MKKSTVESELQPVINAITKVFEFVESFKEAKEDGEVNLREKVTLTIEAFGVLGSFWKIKGIEVSKATELDIQELSTLIMDFKPKKANFLHDDVVNILRAAKNVVEVIERKR
jgi:hypothetical protein